MKLAFVFNKKTSNSVDEAEFDTQETIDAITTALTLTGNEVIQIPMTRDESWVADLRRSAPDLIFNTAEGYQGIGRESYGPIVFEQLGIPYLGPGPYVCFLTLDKFLTKQMVAQHKVPVVEGFFVTRLKELETGAQEIIFPAFVKPNYEGSSKGITKRSLCRTYKDLITYGKDCLRQFPEGLLIERFIPGRDISIGFLAGVGPDDGVLDPVEYETTDQVSDEWVYDYEYKNSQQEEKIRVVCPARISESLRSEIKRHMRRCVDALGIVDMGRADFRVTPEGELFFMEFNALPSLQPGAGIFEATKLLGFTYHETIQKIVDAAITRMKIRGKRSRPSHKTNIKNPKIALVYNLKRKKIHEEGFENEAEFDSQATVDSILGALQELGHQAMPIEATRDLAEQLKNHEINLVFNIAEGIASRARESQVPAICELLGIEYTGSDTSCLSVTLDKAVSKRLVAGEGILTPKSRLFAHPPKKLPKTFDLAFPIIVKPNYEGTSKGISENSVVFNESELLHIMAELWKAIPGPILVEEYISGREFTVGVLGNSTLRTLGPMEIRFKQSSGKYPTYTLKAKTEAAAEDNQFLTLICPVTDLAPALDKGLSLQARKAYRALGCRDVGRVDFRVNAKGDIYFLEANPLPGLAPNFSDLTIMAQRSGWSYQQLIKTILNPAVQRWRAAMKRSSLSSV